MITFSKLGKNGRLGNQLFQIASTIGMANLFKDKAVFPKWQCSYTNKDFSEFFQNKLDHSLNPADIQNIYKENGFQFNNVKHLPNMDLQGYFQTDKYFKHCENIIRHYFEPNPALIKELKLWWEIVLMSNTCAVHVRRGDYVNHKVHQICDLDYYNRCIQKMQQEQNIDNFLIFSDDIQWCSENITGNCIYVEDQTDIEDLFLMSLCNHHIISNSSFSWWSSWLCTNPNKVIYAPSKWFGDSANINDKDVYTNNMTKIDVK